MLDGLHRVVFEYPVGLRDRKHRIQRQSENRFRDFGMSQLFEQFTQDKMIGGFLKILVTLGVIFMQPRAEGLRDPV